jgi:spore coat protein A
VPPQRALTRRQLLVTGVVAGAASMLPACVPVWPGAGPPSAGRAPGGRSALPGASIPKFVDGLPTFVGARVTGTALTVSVEEFRQAVLPGHVYPEGSAGTWVWGYRVGSRPPSFPGFTIEARRGEPTTVTHVNNLPPPGTSKLAGLLTIDQTLHWADPLKQMGSTSPYRGPIPVVVHLHGGETPAAFDGGPLQWFTRDGRRGPGYRTGAPAGPNAAVYRYPNAQPAATLWFHEHALGIARIGVFAGLAAFYLVRDGFDTGRPDNPLGLPAGAQEIELVIQDRQFDTHGQLLFPDGSPPQHPIGLDGPPPNPGVHPFWIPEFFGDAMVVNGKTWPYLDVEPRRYRLRCLNAANARFLRMALVDAAGRGPAPPLWLIGTDGGLLDRPVRLDDPSRGGSPPWLLAPAERADVVVDFTGLAGRTFTLTNSAPAPYPDGDKPDPASTGQIMRFRVSLPLSSSDTTVAPAQVGSLRGGPNRPPPIVRLADAAAGRLAAGVTPSLTRRLVLVEAEGASDDAPIMVLLNNTRFSGLREGTAEPVAGSRPDRAGQGTQLTELPRVGSTELWEVANLTDDAHPIHVHLVQFQVVNRQGIGAARYRQEYDSRFPGGTFAGLLPDGTWGPKRYAPGRYIPGYGPPLPYATRDATGAVGGNPDFTPYLVGAASPPEADEVGWKDTVRMYPAQITRLAVRWAPTEAPVGAVRPGRNLFPFDPTSGPGYVWHCHILDHEDNDMMRPYALVR